jgi:hypothetical protein
MKATIDQMESGIAVLISREDESVHITLPVSLLPAGSREGDIVTVTIERDDVTTKEAKDQISHRVERLRKK